LTLGSGWPYGGSQVPITEAAGTLRVVRVKTDGHSGLIPLPSLVSGEELIAAFLRLPNTDQAEHFERLTDSGDSMIRPPENTNASEVLLFISSRTGMQVKRAAVGAEG